MPAMFTSSIDRRVSCRRSTGASATSSRPAARNSSRSARSVTFSRADSCSRSASENPVTTARPAADATSLTRSTAAARLPGTPAILTSPAAAGRDTGAPTSAATFATRTNVVLVPWRRRRRSSASTPMLMISCEWARLSASATVFTGHADCASRIAHGEGTVQSAIRIRSPKSASRVQHGDGVGDGLDQTADVVDRDAERPGDRRSARQLSRRTRDGRGGGGRNAAYAARRSDAETDGGAGIDAGDVHFQAAYLLDAERMRVDALHEERAAERLADRGGNRRRCGGRDRIAATRRQETQAKNRCKNPLHGPQIIPAVWHGSYETAGPKTKPRATAIPTASAHPSAHTATARAVLL